MSGRRRPVRLEEADTLAAVHPFERLRYVARGGSAPDRVLVAEAVPALAAFADDPSRLLLALRQLIGRQPDSPGLVVLGARMLAALDPIEAAWAFADELEADDTITDADRLAHEQGLHVEVVDCVASGPGEVLVPPGAGAWMDDAVAENRTIIGVTPLGTRLPRLLWQGFLARCDRDRPYGAPTEMVSVDRFDQLAGPGQAGDGWSSDCSDVAELASF